MKGRLECSPYLAGAPGSLAAQDGVKIFRMQTVFEYGMRKGTVIAARAMPILQGQQQTDIIAQCMSIFMHPAPLQF